MKNRWVKIKSFTLNEMIVVLLITTIVVGMAFAVLNLVQSQMNGIGKNYGKNTELNLLRQSLWVDFNRFNRVVYDGKKEELTFSNELETTIYTFEEDRIIKDKDTFDIKLHTRKFYFNSVARMFGEIDALDIQSTKEYGGQRLFVYKNNTAATYMNQ